MSETFAKSTVEKMIRHYADVELVIEAGSAMSTSEDWDVWVLSNGVTIKLPSGFKRIEESYVQLISEVKLELPDYEYDYWVGEQKNIN